MNVISHVVSFRYERRIRPPARFQSEFIATATLIRSATAEVRGPGTCQAGRPSDADEASRQGGAINTLPKGAGLRTSAHRVRPPLPTQRRRRNAMRVLKSFSIALLAFAVVGRPSLAGATLENDRVTVSNVNSVAPDVTVMRSESDA